MLRPDPPTIDDVERAAANLAGRVHRTPLLSSATLEIDVAGAGGVAVVVSGGNVAPETASGILSPDED